MAKATASGLSGASGHGRGGEERSVGDYWIALLRGINVGTAKRVAMADLRALVADLGYEDVTTLLNSGNVVFRNPGRPASPGPAIERALVARLGIQASVIALPARTLDRILRDNPLAKPSRDPSRLLIVVVKDPPTLARLAALADHDWGREQLACGPSAGYAWCPDGISAGTLFPAVNKALGDGVTVRNWATMLKVQAIARARKPTTSKPDRRAK
jgi:uncharacterized protein (DUF1697 family)